MAIQATKTTNLTINANHLRYSLNVRGEINPHTRELVPQIFLTCQRAEKRPDGTWVDDPTAGSSGSLCLTLQEFCQNNPELAPSLAMIWQGLSGLVEQGALPQATRDALLANLNASGLPAGIIDVIDRGMDGMVDAINQKFSLV
jgi:hypothetical protein